MEGKGENIFLIISFFVGILHCDFYQALYQCPERASALARGIAP
jgi:hypothetical protein